MAGFCTPYFRMPDIRYPVGRAAMQYVPTLVAKAYNFPLQFTGKGRLVGIIELGGGFQIDELIAYFRGLGMSPPDVKAVSVQGGQNSPGNPADGEVMLDIC